MHSKKNLFISIIIVLLLIVFVFGVTYAFFSATVDSGSFDGKTGEVIVNYDKPDPLTGELMPSPDRSKGLMTTASASLDANSLDALFNMYITPTSIDNLNIAALKWEVEAIRDNTIIDDCSNSGNFDGVSANTKINMISGCVLSTSTTTFNVYIWLDESLVTEAINNVNFNAKIGADTVPITAEFE